MTTIYDIARRAGVSVATVSRYLNASATVSPDTANRIQQAVGETDFALNRLASALTTKRTGLIGLITSDKVNPFTTEVAQAMAEEASELGFSLFTAITGGDEARFLQLLTEFRQQQVDGVVVTPPDTPKTHAALTDLIRGGTPVTTIGIDLQTSGAGFVSVRTYDGALAAVRHLVALGHRRVGFLTGLDPATVAQGRLAGYTAALREASIRFDRRLVVGDTLDVAGGRRGLGQLLGLERPPTAVFTVNDVMALGVLQAAQAQRIHVPEELSVVGFDDIAMASHAAPPLTTVAQPKTLLGRTAARFVIGQVQDHRTPEPLRLECRLVIRASTAPPPTT